MIKDDDEDELMLDAEDEEDEQPVKPKRGRPRQAATTGIKLKVVDTKKRKRPSVNYVQQDTDSEFEDEVEEEEIPVRTTRNRKPTKAQLKKKKEAERKKMEEGDTSDFEDSLAANAPVPGQIAFCAECNCRFTVTAYSRASEDGDGLLCYPCGNKKKKNAPAQTTTRKKQTPAARANKKSHARALLDGDTSGIKSLQDMCIDVIAKHIDDVETLGHIGSHNLDKISQILCKNRRLNDQTIKLFFEPAEHVLRFYDCSSKSIHTYIPHHRNLFYTNSSFRGFI